MSDVLKNIGGRIRYVMTWAVVMVRPNFEGKALRSLQQQGFEAYAPRYKARRVKRGQVRTVPRFLFPRYVFIRIAEVWQSVLNVIGFVTLVKAENDAPAKISDKVIDALKARENPFGLIELNAGGWRHGQRLRITEGPFRGEVALHLEVDAQQNEIALLNLLGRRVRVQLDARSVEAA